MGRAPNHQQQVTRTNMDINHLTEIVVNALEDVKAKDIKVFNTEHLTDQFERVVIASGNSNRQTRALASSVAEDVKSNGGEVLSTEGRDTGEWVLVDLGQIVVHCLQPAVREYYNLEEIWGGKEVFMQLDEDSRARVMPHRA